MKVFVLCIAIVIAVLVGLRLEHDSQRALVPLSGGNAVGVETLPPTSAGRMAEPPRSAVEAARAAKTVAPATTDALARAFSQHRSGVQVAGEGVVSQLLADDKDGRRHQRFVLRLASGQTVLVAHNIDLAARLDGLAVGDRVAFNGVYEWNAKGGTVHWTHRDPARQHEAGWLRHQGRTVQ